MQILCLKKNAKERYKDWEITEKKKGQMGKKQQRILKVDSGGACVTIMVKEYKVEQYVQERTRKEKVIEIKGMLEKME